MNSFVKSFIHTANIYWAMNTFQTLEYCNKQSWQNSIFTVYPWGRVEKEVADKNICKYTNTAVCLKVVLQCKKKMSDMIASYSSLPTLKSILLSVGWSWARILYSTVTTIKVTITVFYKCKVQRRVFISPL